jgi:hypothetical protein
MRGPAWHPEPALATYRRKLSAGWLEAQRVHWEAIRKTLISPEQNTQMPDQEWIKTLEDGRKVKFIYQELPEDGAFITAQLERNEVVYSVLLTKARNPLSREDVESHFEGEFSKKQ